MPRTGGQLTRDRIVRKAAEQFRQQGYRATGIRDILKACRVSKGTFYFYFDSKQQVCEAVIDHYAEFVPHAILAAFSGKTWHEGVEACLAGFQGPKSRPSLFGAPLSNLGLEFVHSNPFLIRKVVVALKKAESTLERVFRERGFRGQTARARAATFMAALIGHTMRMSITKDARHAHLVVRQISALGETAGRGRGSRRGRARAAHEGPPRGNNFSQNGIDIIDDRSIIVQVSSLHQGRNETAEKRFEILEQTARLFWERGFSATTVSEVAARCGVPKGSFHYYFASKRALAAAVIELLRQRCEALVDEAVSRETWSDAAEFLSDAAEREHSMSGFWCPLGNVGLEIANADSELGLDVAAIYQTMEDKFAAVICSNGLEQKTARERAARAVALLQGHLTRMIIYGEPSIGRQLRRDLLELVK